MWFGKAKRRETELKNRIVSLGHQNEALMNVVEDLKAKTEKLAADLTQMTGDRSRAVIEKSQAETAKKAAVVSGDRWHTKVIEVNKALDARDEYWGEMCKQITEILRPGLESYYTDNPGDPPWKGKL